jgi:hypothetical protein
VDRRKGALKEFKQLKNLRSFSSGSANAQQATAALKQRFWDKLSIQIRLYAGDIVNSWQESTFTSDSSLDPFISSSKTYSHALNFGWPVNTSVNGVTFLPVQPNQSDDLLQVSAPFFINPTNLNGVTSLGPKSDTLCGAFVYGAPFGLTLKNLIPGTAYKLTFFHYPWDDPNNPDAAIIQKILERFTGRPLSFIRGRYSIYSIEMRPDKTFVTFDFLNDSHLYALVCEKI